MSKYRVCVDDNFHYMDESQRYVHGEYGTVEEALSVAKGIVDDSLKSLYKPGMATDELYAKYKDFGEDPFIVSDDKNCHFSAWNYAEERCDEICSQTIKSGMNTAFRVNAMKKLWLIRHAESEANAGMTTAFPKEIALTKVGMQQAKHLADSFACKPSLVVTSSYLRTIQTAQLLIKRFPDVKKEKWDVEEFTYLDLNKHRNTTEKERKPFVNAFWQRCDSSYNDGFGAESFKDFLQRVHRMIRNSINCEEASIVIFTHGYIIRAVLWLLSELPSTLETMFGLIAELNTKANSEITSESMMSFYEFCQRTPFPNTAILQIVINTENESIFDIAFGKETRSIISFETLNPPFVSMTASSSIDTFVVPDPSAKRIQIPIAIRGGKIVMPVGISLADFTDSEAVDVIIPAYIVKDEELKLALCEEKRVIVLPTNTKLMVNINQHKVPENLKDKAETLTTTRLSGKFVEMILQEDLELIIHKTKKPCLADCSCFIPALNKKADSINHAYSLISTAFEPDRRSHTGNVFAKVLYYESCNETWHLLDDLRRTTRFS